MQGEWLGAVKNSVYNFERGFKEIGTDLSGNSGLAPGSNFKGSVLGLMCPPIVYVLCCDCVCVVLCRVVLCVLIVYVLCCVVLYVLMCM